MSLSNKYKKNSFKVPEGYFENVTDRIQKSIAEERESVKNPKFIVMIRPYIAIAAGMMFIAFMFGQVFSYFEKDIGDKLTSDIIYESIVQDDLLIVSDDFLMNALAENVEVTNEDIQNFDEVDNYESNESEVDEMYQDILY